MNSAQHSPTEIIARNINDGKQTGARAPALSHPMAEDGSAMAGPGAGRLPVIGSDRVLDVRALPCSVKHGLIIRTFRELPIGDHFILMNSHDPVRLHDQFTAEWPETFTWEHLAPEPEAVRVKITKLKAANGGSPAPFGPCGH
jgi:uncharacterized protein (DUF2249 family)